MEGSLSKIIFKTPHSASISTDVYALKFSRTFKKYKRFNHYIYIYWLNEYIFTTEIMIYYGCGIKAVNLPADICS